MPAHPKEVFIENYAQVGSILPVAEFGKPLEVVALYMQSDVALSSGLPRPLAAGDIINFCTASPLRTTALMVCNKGEEAPFRTSSRNEVNRRTDLPLLTVALLQRFGSFYLNPR